MIYVLVRPLDFKPAITIKITPAALLVLYQLRQAELPGSRQESPGKEGPGSVS
jgi:hypothetical protein